jgi:hypothetical protein
MENKNYFYNGNATLASFGQFGMRVLTNNSIEGETFLAIQAMEDSVISCELNEYENEIGDTSITSLTLLSGTVIYGRFVNLEVASGKVIAYKG